ncbi:MAG: glycosyltransferase [Anaerolineae bacterium]|jgi:UDP:flavonoid glycosyltransferase YjiC (YdhE family)
MRVAIPTIGSRGDVQPFIALAQGLTRAGHTVTLASHPLMRPLVQSHGVAFLPIGPDIDLASKAAAIRRGSRSTAAGLVRAMRFSFDMLRRSHDDILALCREADLVVVSAQSAAGKNEADQLGLPYLSVTLMPWAVPWDDPQRPLFRRTAYRLIDSLVSLLTTRPLNRIRGEQGLPPVGREGFTSLRLNLVPVSPAVYEPNPHWEPHHRVVGYWFADAPTAWQPPAELSAFLDAGEPPILISLGAMSLGDGDASQIARLFVDAVQRAGVWAIIQGWDAAVRQLPLPPTIHAAGSLPHSWLLPRCAAVVHHGGFGTTAAGFRAGIPALVIPHIADQFFWANIVHQLGIGPQPIRRPKLSATALAASLHELVQNPDLSAAASSLGEQIQAESGVDNAVRHIEEEFL